MGSEIASPGVLDSLSGFLRWGPTGLAGLMLVLVIMALASGKLNASRERVLTKLMYIGALCFALALAATFIPTPGSAAQVVQLQSQIARQRAAMNPVVTAADGLIAQLQRASQQIDKSCSGGSNGVSPANAPATIAIHTAVSNSIASSKAALEAAMTETLSTAKN